MGCFFRERLCSQELRKLGSTVISSTTFPEETLMFLEKTGASVTQVVLQVTWAKQRQCEWVG